VGERRYLKSRNAEIRRLWLEEQLSHKQIEKIIQKDFPNVGVSRARVSQILKNVPHGTLTKANQG